MESDCPLSVLQSLDPTVQDLNLRPLGYGSMGAITQYFVQAVVSGQRAFPQNSHRPFGHQNMDKNGF